MERSTDRWWRKPLLLLLTLSTMLVLAGCPAPEDGGVGGAEPALEGSELDNEGVDGVADDAGAEDIGTEDAGDGLEEEEPNTTND